MTVLQPMMSNVFAGAGLDRAQSWRSDPDWLANSLAADDVLAVILWKGQPWLEGRGGVQSWASAWIRAVVDAGAETALLGLLDGRPVIALDLPPDREWAPPGQGGFAELLGAVVSLDHEDAARVGAARSILMWSRRHRFCANCGGATQVEQAGWRRRCLACKASHHPRTDPVVIMLPLFEGRCLMGRHVAWPVAHSALAGFVEPGESLEEACARELHEEVGLDAACVRYHSSQPWPFPHSLMVGLFAEVTHDRVRLDPAELIETVWLTRKEARDVLAGVHGAVKPPTPFSIAFQLLKAWSAGECAGS